MSVTILKTNFKNQFRDQLQFFRTILVVKFITI